MGDRAARRSDSLRRLAEETRRQPSLTHPGSATRQTVPNGPSALNFLGPNVEVAVVNDTGQFPGWYVDPADSSRERFWNGTVWSDKTREGPKLSDYLGPIEPLLLQLLSSSEITEEADRLMSATE